MAPLTLFRSFTSWKRAIHYVFILKQTHTRCLSLCRLFLLYGSIFSCQCDSHLLYVCVCVCVLLLTLSHFHITPVGHQKLLLPTHTRKESLLIEITPLASPTLLVRGLWFVFTKVGVGELRWAELNPSELFRDELEHQLHARPSCWTSTSLGLCGRKGIDRYSHVSKSSENPRGWESDYLAPCNTITCMKLMWKRVFF